jgi:hypothetical protein
MITRRVFITATIAATMGAKSCKPRKPPPSEKYLREQIKRAGDAHEPRPGLGEIRSRIARGEKPRIPEEPPDPGR